MSQQGGQHQTIAASTPQTRLIPEVNQQDPSNKNENIPIFRSIILVSFSAFMTYASLLLFQSNLQDQIESNWPNHQMPPSEIAIFQHGISATFFGTFRFVLCSEKLPPYKSLQFISMFQTYSVSEWVTKYFGLHSRAKRGCFYHFAA